MKTLLTLAIGNTYMEMLEVNMEVDNVGNVVAEMVGDMEVDRVADELDMLVAKVAEMAGVKCV